MSKAKVGAIKSFFRVLVISAKCHVANQNSHRAVALTYYTLFAVVPVTALLFGIAKGFNLDEKLRVSLNNHFAQHGEILEWIQGFADTTLKQASGGIVAGIGVIALLWTVLSLAGNIEKALNAVWGLAARRNMLRRFSDCITVMLLTPIILVIVTSTDVLVKKGFQSFQAAYPGIDHIIMVIFTVLVTILPFVLTTLIFFLIYYLAPNTRVHFKSALLAAVVAGLFYTLMQNGFVFLQKTIFRYNRIYGSFAVLPLFLIWIQWAWQIVLYGAEISYVAQNLNTGLFDLENATPASVRLQRIQELAIARIIYKNLESGNGSTSWHELEKRLHIAAVEIDRGIDCLLEAGIIVRTSDADETRFVPSMPPDKLSVVECLATLNNYGRNNVPEDMAIESAELEKVMNSFAVECAKSEINKKLCDL